MIHNKSEQMRYSSLSERIREIDEKNRMQNGG